MGRRRLLAISGLLLGAGLGYALYTLAAGPRVPGPDAGPPPPLSAPDPARRAGLPQPMLGFALDLHHTQHLERYLDAVDRMAELGFNTVQVLTPMFQVHAESEQIARETGPGAGPAREDLITLLRHIEARGLHAVLMPVVLLRDPEEGQWRGRIEPANWDTWWAHYERQILHFAEIAREGGVDVFSIGSELLSTEDQPRRWRALARRVRRRFDGPLLYSTNWDHYRQTRLWGAVDLVGVNGYFDLTTGGRRPEALAARWGELRDRLLAWAARTKRPLLLTEVGYPSLPWGLSDPWNYVPEEETPPAPGVQHAGYRAFLEAWGGALAAPDPDRLLGVVFYRWDPYFAGGPEDRGYGVRGKPALELLRRWMAEHADPPGAG